MVHKTKDLCATETVQIKYHMVRMPRPNQFGSSDFDVIIIGAGINGAGIARDAAMRGLKVLLLDKGDIGGGTSSASTRLIHGGLRYLEHLEFGLVRESLRERETLLRIAPHLVRPLAITIPIYKRGTRGRTTIRAGMLAYDLLSFGKSLPRYRMLSCGDTLKQSPGLNPEGLLGSAVYFDAQVEFAERLVLENVLAARESGAQVFTYAPVTKFVVADGLLFGVEFESEGVSRFVKAGVVINAAGPWVDRLLARAPFESPHLIGGTKGSHIVVPAFPGASKNAIYLEAQSDRRPFFIIPWNGNYLIGTTDVRFEDDPDQVRSESWEIDYLLAETNLAFPAAGLTRANILYTCSGVRPLPWTSEKDEQSITRKHFIREHPQARNLLSIVGGKLTTYRSLAEECVDLVFRKLGKQSPVCSTARELLPGAVNFTSTATAFPERWLRIYGSRAREVAKLADDELAAEVVFAFERESATTLADCFLRRTMVGLNGDLGLSKLEAAAEIGMRLLGWTEVRAKCEAEAYRNEVSRFVIPKNSSTQVTHARNVSEASGRVES
jgi:glycerol-3-phosphate dehydrogenase